MSDLTPQQIVQILQTPLGKDYFIDDEAVIAERKKISAKYSELKSTPRLFTAEELKNTPHGKDGVDKMLIPGFEECSIEARAWWLNTHVLNPAERTVNEDCICPSCQYDPPGLCKPNCVCPCHVE